MKRGLLLTVALVTAAAATPSPWIAGEATIDIPFESPKEALSSFHDGGTVDPVEPFRDSGNAVEAVETVTISSPPTALSAIDDLSSQHPVARSVACGKRGGTTNGVLHQSPDDDDDNGGGYTGTYVLGECSGLPRNCK